MKEKEITITNKETGEQSTGTMKQVIELTGLTRMTIFRKLKYGSFETDKFTFSQTTTEEENVTMQPQDVTMIRENVTMVEQDVTMPEKNVTMPPENVTMIPQNVTVFDENVTMKKAKCYNDPVTVTPKTMQQRPADPEQQTEYKKTIIPSGPCIYCGENVYHTAIIEGKKQFVCYGKCEPINHDHSRKRTMIPNALKSLVNS